jgi:N-acetylneuraminic acid mutarotase
MRTKHYKWNGSSWTEVSTLPYDFINGSAVVYNDEIHILGSSRDQTKHYKWNGTTWTEASTLPYMFDSSPAVVYSNEIHILGGQRGQKNHYRWIGTEWTNKFPLTNPDDRYYTKKQVDEMIPEVPTMTPLSRSEIEAICT